MSFTFYLANICNREVSYIRLDRNGLQNLADHECMHPVKVPVDEFSLDKNLEIFARKHYA